MSERPSEHEKQRQSEPRPEPADGLQALIAEIRKRRERLELYRRLVSDGGLGRG